MHKNPLQNAGKGVEEILFFKIFRGSMPRTPVEVSAPLARVIHVYTPPPPKFLNPYAYAVHTHNKNILIIK